MWKTFRILIKKVRFYVFIISAFFIIQAATLEYQYKTEYNRTLGEYTQHAQDKTDYAFTCEDGSKWEFHCSFPIYKDEIENIMKHQLGENYIYDTYTKAANIFVWAIVPFIVSLFMCLNILLIENPDGLFSIYSATGIIVLAIIFVFVARNFVSCTADIINYIQDGNGVSYEEEKERHDKVRQYEENHKDDWNGYKGTRRNSWAEDEKLKQDGYDPKEYRKQHGYKYYD